MSDGQAAVQLFHRLNHARQTVDFVRRQRAAFTRLNKARMTVFEVRRLRPPAPERQRNRQSPRPSAQPSSLPLGLLRLRSAATFITLQLLVQL